MVAEEIFDRAVVAALEAAGGKMKVAELRKAAHTKRGIISHLQDMKARNLVSFSPGELTMETEVTLGYGS